MDGESPARLFGGNERRGIPRLRHWLDERRPALSAAAFSGPLSIGAAITRFSPRLQSVL